jgi:hypothetical protein
MKHGEMCQQVDPTGSIHLKEVKNVSTTCRILQFTLCNYMEISGKLDYPLITSAMQQVWPRAKPLTKHDMFNVQVKIMQLLPVFMKSNGDYERFTEVVNASALLDGIENEVNLDDDEPYKVAQTLWLELAVSTSDKDDVLFLFIEYLEPVKSKAKGFVYKLAETSSNNSPSGKK